VQSVSAVWVVEHLDGALLFLYIPLECRSQWKERNKNAPLYSPASTTEVFMKRMSAIEKRVLRNIGSLGGKASAAKLSPKERQEKARKAVQTRWANAKKK
jgi:hypothetical protein